MKYPALLVLLCFVLPGVLVQNENPEIWYKSLDSIAVNQQWAAEIPGLAVGVISNNRVAFKKVYGVQSLKSRQHLTTDSDFHMAFVSKPLIATAILQLVEIGKLNLDSTVVHYLPYFTMKDEQFGLLRFITS